MICRRATAEFLAVVVGLILVSIGATARAEQTVESLTGGAVPGVGPFVQDVTDAIKKFGSGDYPGAFANLESARKSTPRLPPAEIMMAQLYFDANQPGAGIGMLERAARTVPDDPEALVLLGELAVREGRGIEAGLLFGKAAPVVSKFTENPKRRQTLQNRLYSAWATVDEAEGNFPQAQKKLEELLRLDTRNAAAQERLGRVLFKQNKLREAYEAFKAAAQLDPKAPPAELAMAALFQDRSKAEQWLNRAIENAPKDVRTQLAAGEYRLRTNVLDEAQKHAAEAIKLDPTNVDANLLAGVVARMNNDYPAAARYLGEAHLMAPANGDVINHLALSLIELPDEAARGRALQFADLNARQHPDSIPFMTTLGWISYKLNRKKDAERLLNASFRAVAAANNNKMNADMAYYLASLAKDTGKLDYAAKLLREAINSSDSFAYRKPAQKMLAEIEKGPASPGGARSADTARSKAGRGAAEAPEKSGEAETSPATK